MKRSSPRKAARVIARPKRSAVSPKKPIAKEESSYQRIYRVVRRIPRGRVATYGQIAELAGMPRAARQVGYALAALRDDIRGVPWHRVLNARGEISLRSEPGFDSLQRHLLEREGVKFDANGRLSLERYQWRAGV